MAYLDHLEGEALAEGISTLQPWDEWIAEADAVHTRHKVPGPLPSTWPAYWRGRWWMKSHSALSAVACQMDVHSPWRPIP